MKRLFTKLALASAILLAATSFNSAPAAAAGNSYAIGTTVAFSLPTPYSSMVGGYWSGTWLTMHCWVDNAWSYGTNRWFLVSGAGYNPYTGRLNWVRGYVSANKVGNQSRVGHC